MISTPVSRLAATAPACTDCQKIWELPLGITAMVFLWSRLHELVNTSSAPRNKNDRFFMMVMKCLQHGYGNDLGAVTDCQPSPFSALRKDTRSFLSCSVSLSGFTFSSRFLLGVPPLS